ncbi:hypothetical protein QG516_03370 [Pedobacter gandavensis]|uniref:hypothetical protein n=1 Tax=Pedobacter gandavensis TaxID=2679963 RepID=UPI002478A738|nr:hypothetical protein [Pedobacter gandavensis]WGQ10694.1 hypothetical protein QG516_03370 [Pedobacter gandavensis]
MENIEQESEPFEIQVTIDQEVKCLLVIPDWEEPKYAIFDVYTSLGTVWKESGETRQVWRAQGLIATSLLGQLSEQIDGYLNSKPV